MRITERGYEIYPQIIARTDTIHVVWQQIAAVQQVSYMRSIDAGNYWGELIDLVDDEHSGSWSDLSLSNDHIVIGWKDGTIHQPYERNQGYSVSSSGDYWSEARYLYPNGYDGAGAFAFAHSGDSLYSVYLANSQDSTGYVPIIFLYSSDFGTNWGDNYTIGYTSETVNGLLIAKCGGSLIIVWTGVPYPELTGYEAMAVVSSDGGQTWSERLMLSEFGLPPAQRPCLSCNSATVEIAVGWLDYSYPGDLFIRISVDGGDTWEPEIHVTDHHSISNPNIEYVGDTLWAVWDDLSFSNQRELGFKKSTDRGQSWSSIERLTDAEGQSHRPWLSYDNGKLHLVWDDSRPPHGGSEIYYKRWEADVGINEGEKPEISSLLTAYPNPFNSTTLMAYSNLRGGDIEIYNIAGQLVKELRVRGSKEGKITWDGTDATGASISSGIYFARATGSDSRKTLKLVYLK